MRYAAVLSTVPLALALAACGGGADEAEAPAPAETEAPVADVATPAPDASESPAAEGEDDASATDTDASPTPSPSASAKATPTPAPTPSQAAAAPPPMFAVCRACHSPEPGENGIGPSLAGVFNAKAGHVGTFEYSDAMKGSGLTWNQATLDRYLESPQKVVPGTIMSYAGLKNEAQRKAIIDYLKTL